MRLLSAEISVQRYIDMAISILRFSENQLDFVVVNRFGYVARADQLEYTAPTRFRF